LLAQVFPREVVDAAIGRAGVKELRERALPARLMVYFVIGMWLWSSAGYVRVLKKVTAGLRWAADDAERDALPYDGSIAKARARLGEAVMADLFADCAGPVGRVGEAGVFFAGLRVASLDGTVFDAKPTPENVAAFAVPAGGVLPQVRLLAFAECGTMALLGAAFDSAEVGERELAGRLLGRFAPGMLVLADRGFPSFELWRDAMASGADLAWRVSVSFALITTLLDPAAYRALDLVGLYAARWQVELLFKILKVELRESGTVLRSKSPAMIRQELWGLLCCYQAVRLATAHVAARAHVEVRRVKFPELFDAVRDSVATVIFPLHA